jgi:diacylglycerol O-acyltransferase / wax synthase
MPASPELLSRPDRPVIERASAADRAFLAMDASGAVPEQFGVILVLDRAAGFDLATARRLIAERIAAVPRLRQRLVRVPFGCGGPIWVDDLHFDIRDHVHAVCCPQPGDQQSLLDTAVTVIRARLPLAAPLWSAVLVTGLADGTAALVVVLHHALADGIGGLAVLASLIDTEAGLISVRFPRPAPLSPALAREAFRARLRGLRHIPQSWRELRAAMGAGGGLHPPRAAPCSLNQRTGPRRELAVIRTEAAAVRAAAHRHGVTTNDAVLAAVAAALHRVVAARGESVSEIVVAVPVSGRRPGGGADMGNVVSPMLVRVPVMGDVAGRLERVAASVRAHRAAATGPSPIAVLGWLFRPLAAVGGYRWYLNHQHRFHTLVSHVRGPAEPVTFAGFTVASAIPVVLAEGGNITVYFEVLSYAGALTVTAIADPDHFPGLDLLADVLHAELNQIIHAPALP